jgi:hypothetical protein
MNKIPHVGYVCGVFLAVGVAQTAWAAEPVQIHACVNANGANAGQVRVVSPTQPCLKNEVRITWSGNLAGLSCPSGQFVTGFNSSGTPVCGTPTGTGGGGGGTTNDADGDGIADAVDACPNAPNLFFNSGSYCPASLYGVTLGQLPVAANVYLLNLHVDDVSGSAITVSIQPADPGYNGPVGSSLTVQLGALPVPAVNSRVNLIGTVLAGNQLAVASVVVVTGP